MLWHLSFGGETWDTLVLEFSLEMVLPTADNIRNTNIRLQGEPRVAMIRNEALQPNLERTDVVGNICTTDWLYHFHLRSFIYVSSTQCFDVEHDFSCGCFWKVFNNRIQQKWSKLTLAFVLFYFLSIIFLFLYSFFLTNWHKLYQWLHKARQEVFISISFGTGWFPTLGLRDISTSPYGVVLETVQGKTTSFIYRALFNWIQTFLRRQKTLRILESTFSNNLRYIENIYFFCDL